MSYEPKRFVPSWERNTEVDLAEQNRRREEEVMEMVTTLLQELEKVGFFDALGQALIKWKLTWQRNRCLILSIICTVVMPPLGMVWLICVLVHRRAVKTTEKQFETSKEPPHPLHVLDVLTHRSLDRDEVIEYLADRGFPQSMTAISIRRLIEEDCLEEGDESLSMTDRGYDVLSKAIQMRMYEPPRHGVAPQMDTTEPIDLPAVNVPQPRQESDESLYSEMQPGEDW